jgi:hypothetical protein
VPHVDRLRPGRRLVVVLLAGVASAMSGASRAQGAKQVLTGTAAQKSPQADVFLLYGTR